MPIQPSSHLCRLAKLLCSIVEFEQCKLFRWLLPCTAFMAAYLALFGPSSFSYSRDGYEFQKVLGETVQLSYILICDITRPPSDANKFLNLPVSMFKTTQACQKAQTTSIQTTHNLVLLVGASCHRPAHLNHSNSIALQAPHLKYPRIQTSSDDSPPACTPQSRTPCKP